MTCITVGRGRWSTIPKFVAASIKRRWRSILARKYDISTEIALQLPYQAHANERLSHARVPARWSMPSAGIYKARWRRLLKRSEVVYSVVPKVAFTCATLHNIVEDRGEPFQAQWLAAAAADAGEQPAGEVYDNPQGAEFAAAAADRKGLCRAMWERRAH